MCPLCPPPPGPASGVYVNHYCVGPSKKYWNIKKTFGPHHFLSLRKSRGGSRIFILVPPLGGGGTQKVMCQLYSTHITSAEPNSLSAGVQGQGPGSSRVVLMFSRAFWALFLSVLIKKKKIGLTEKHSWSNFRGAPWIRHCFKRSKRVPFLDQTRIMITF